MCISCVGAGVIGYDWGRKVPGTQGTVTLSLGEMGRSIPHLSGFNTKLTANGFWIWAPGQPYCMCRYDIAI